jgi:cell division transport system permease protein
MASKKFSDEATTPPNAAMYFTREACRRLWRSKRTSSVSIGMIAIAVFILGAFLLIAENLSHTVELWEGTSRVSIYLKAGAKESEVAALRAHLAASPLLNRFQYVSQEEAREKFRKHFTGLSGVIDQLEENPFPASFDVHVTEATVNDTTFDDKISHLRTMPAVEDVQFDWQWVERLRGVIRAVNLIGLLAGGLLALAAAFTTANVIRLTQVLYREEIAIMRLVGATETMVRGPFLIEGFLQGTIGSIVAAVLLFSTYTAGEVFTRSSPSLLWNAFFVTFLPLTKLLLLIGGGMLAGLVGSWLSLIDNGEEVPA